MFRLLASRAEPLTPALAKEFHELPPSLTERPLIPARIKYLEAKVEGNLLVTFHWAKAKFQGAWVRVNGQHSSAVLANLNGNFPDGLYAHVDEYEVDDTQDLALLFRQFDARKSSRSSGDIAGAYQRLQPALDEVSRPVGKLGVEAINWYNKVVEGSPYLSSEEQYDLFNHSAIHGFLIWLNDLFSMKTPEFKATSIVAAMYATHNQNPDAATEFWRHVSRGGMDAEDETDAPKVLDEWLTEIKAGNVEAKPGELYQGCIYAWNAWRGDKAIKDIRHDTRKSWLAPAA